MPAFNLDAWVARSGALDLSAVAWEDVPRHPARPETLTGYRRLKTIESHPILAELLDRVIVDESCGVQPAAELNFMARYLFAGEEGRVAIRRVDETIRPLPGFASAQLLESWMDLNITGSSSITGGHNGHGHH